MRKKILVVALAAGLVSTVAILKGRGTAETESTD